MREDGDMLKESEVEGLIRQPEGQFLDRKSCYEHIKGQGTIYKMKQP